MGTRIDATFVRASTPRQTGNAENQDDPELLIAALSYERTTPIFCVPKNKRALRIAAASAAPNDNADAPTNTHDPPPTRRRRIGQDLTGGDGAGVNTTCKTLGRFPGRFFRRNHVLIEMLIFNWK